jgi:dTDP-4-dehydrorhamnose reductase
MIDKKDIYHFTNEGVCSWYDFAVAIGKLGENMCNIRPVHSYEYSSKVKRPHYSVLDKVKFRETFGYQIPYWMESLERCINQLKTKKYEI